VHAIGFVLAIGLSSPDCGKPDIFKQGLYATVGRTFGAMLGPFICYWQTQRNKSCRNAACIKPNADDHTAEGHRDRSFTGNPTRCRVAA